MGLNSGSSGASTSGLRPGLWSSIRPSGAAGYWDEGTTHKSDQCSPDIDEKCVYRPISLYTRLMWFAVPAVPLIALNLVIIGYELILGG